MERHSKMPVESVDGWVMKEMTERPGAVALHYHPMAEWLDVVDGEMTFFSAGDRGGEHMVRGKALYIPLGEVHRVEIGDGGATYRMWTPVAAGAAFRLDLDEELRDLVQRNLWVPEQENSWDTREPTAPAEELRRRQDYQFLQAFVSDQLVFCNAGGAFLGKEQYLARAPSPGVQRSSSGSVRLLQVRWDEPASVLLATVVRTRQEKGPPRSFTNLRSFVKGPTGWSCRVWLNFEEPEPGA
jgi:hypothetical protein